MSVSAHDPQATFAEGEDAKDDAEDVPKTAPTDYTIECRRCGKIYGDEDNFLAHPCAKELESTLKAQARRRRA